MKITRNIAAIVFVLSLLGTIYAQNKTQTIDINFQAVVGDQVFDCRETYDGIGTTNSKMTVTDFRFYVQNVRLVDKKGVETPLKLTSDEKFQTERVALLDFENGEGNCAGGTNELNAIVRGAVLPGKYLGLKFNIGVPEELNHLDPTLQPSPLNISKMMWSWQAGYKFARIETKTTGRPNGYVLHLGSTECKTDAGNGKTVCGKANRPEFAFAKFDPKTDAVVIDLKSLFAGANVDVNQEKTASGCMSFEGDSDCATVFKNLGLAYAGNTPSAQTFLRVGKALKTAAKNTKLK